MLNALNPLKRACSDPDIHAFQSPSIVLQDVTSGNIEALIIRIGFGGILAYIILCCNKEPPNPSLIIKAPIVGYRNRRADYSKSKRTMIGCPRGKDGSVSGLFMVFREDSIDPGHGSVTTGRTPQHTLHLKLLSTS